jgi:uncharacterized SAM-binding protein YcdF (DUF218 family)
MKIKRKSVFRFVRILLLTIGFFFIFLCILALTTLPFYARYWLATHNGCVDHDPLQIVLLGGSGMPSEDGLIKCYYTALIGNKYPQAGILIVLPGDTTDSISSPGQMKRELVLHGIRSDRIAFENTGHNTRQQALKIDEMFGKRFKDKPLVIVTSPEHMYRSIRCFKKLGYSDVRGLPTFDISVEENNLYFNDKDLKGNQWVPPIGHFKQLRYQFWNHLKYEIQVIREAFAIGYYKLRSWI